MSQLYEIANDSFILLPATQTVGLTLELIRQLAPTAALVRRTEPSTSYYLFITRAFKKQLATADARASLLDVLHLNELQPTPALDAFQEADTALPRCVITDQDRVVGFFDATLDPFEKGAFHDIQRGSSTPNTLIDCSLVADLPREIVLDEATALLVKLSVVTRRKRSLPLALPLGTVVDVMVRPEHGFSVEGPDLARLVVTAEAETPPVLFKLRGTGLGRGRIRILCFHEGHALGSIVLAPTVARARPNVDTGRQRAVHRLGPAATRQNDLTLLSRENKDRPQPTFTMMLSSPDPSLDLYFKRFDSISFKTDPLQYFQSFFSDIEALQMRTGEEKERALYKLARKGAHLFETLLPPELQRLLWDLRERIHIVQVLSDEPWIPWELLKLRGQKDGRVVEGPFFCEAFVMTRWFPGVNRQPQLRLKRMATVIPSDSELESATEERDYLLSLDNKQRQIKEIVPTYLGVLKALSQYKCDGWHFSTHATFNVQDPDLSTIRLNGDESLCAEDISGEVANCGRTHPLVFLNACQTGLSGQSLTGVGGWAKNFIEAGAAAFIGTLWSVDDQAANTFARTFYSNLLAGDTIGEAVRKTRQAMRDDPNQLAYTVFADPLATIE